MKRAFILLVVLLLLLCGCHPVLQTLPDNITEPTMQTTTPVTEETAPSTVPSETMQHSIYYDELCALFSDEGSWYHYALSTYYSSPNEINLYDLFHKGFVDESPIPSDAERAHFLNDYSYSLDTDGLVRLPVEKIEQVLGQYFRVSLNDLDEYRSLFLDYWEETNCYYRPVAYYPEHTLFEDFQPLGAVDCADGSVTLFYTTSRDEHVYAATVIPHDTGFYIVSNTSKDYYDGKVNEDYVIQFVLNAFEIPHSEASNITCRLADPGELDAHYATVNAQYIVQFQAAKHTYTAHAFLYNPDVYGYSRN